MYLCTIVNYKLTFYRQGEVWAKLRKNLTPELTSPKTIRRFLPDVNQLSDDFNNLLSRVRDSNKVIKGFESYCNRMGLESMSNPVVVKCTRVGVRVIDLLMTFKYL